MATANRGAGAGGEVDCVYRYVLSCRQRVLALEPTKTKVTTMTRATKMKEIVLKGKGDSINDAVTYQYGMCRHRA